MTERPRVPLRSIDEVEPETRGVFEELAAERGKVPNLFRAAAHGPAIVRTLREHMRAVMGAGAVDQLLKELLAVRVSHLNDCAY